MTTTTPTESQKFYREMRKRAERVEQLADDIEAWARQTSGPFALSEPLRQYMSRTSDRLTVLVGKLNDAD